VKESLPILIREMHKYFKPVFGPDFISFWFSGLLALEWKLSLSPDWSFFPFPHSNFSFSLGPAMFVVNSHSFHFHPDLNSHNISSSLHSFTRLSLHHISFSFRGAEEEESELHKGKAGGRINVIFSP
jgi:hypothetical protein